MMRIALADEPGWKAPRRGAQAHVLHSLINLHIASLQPMSLPAEPCGSAVATVHTRNARCVFRLLKEPPGSTCDFSVDICESRWDLWVVDNACVWRHSREDEGQQFFAQPPPSAGHVAVTKGVARLHNPHTLERIDSHSSAARGATPANYGGSFVETLVVVRVHDATSRVFFLADDQLHHLHEFEPPHCVNACYTAVVGGLVHALGYTTTINARNKRGPCGSEFYISSVLGVLHIFPCQQGARRVTCKAFVCAADAALALHMACDDLGLGIISEPLVHMIIMKGTTGCGLDISHYGNLAHVLAVRFGDGVVYVPRLDEVNVHSTCTWPCLWDVCADCPPSLRARVVSQRAALLRTKLDVRVTRLGTCIYSATVPKPAVPTDLGRAEIEQCVFALCRHVHSIIGGAGKPASSE
jgi:hypothetical protein